MAELKQFPLPWERDDFKPTGEQMTRIWLDDLRNAGDDFRYVGAQWLVYQEGIWRDDVTHALGRACGAFQRKVGRDLKAAHQNKVEAFAMHNGMLMRIREELAMDVDMFDHNPDWLATPEGIIDLSADDFILIPHKKEHCISRCTAVSPREMKTPIWDRTLEKLVPDEETRKYLYRFWGYCLTGHVSEQCFLFLHGPGASGKSTVLDTIRMIMGTYARQASINLLTRQRFERHPEELAQLRGVRFMVATETDKGAAWDEAKLKAMVSGEPIRAHLMHRDSFEYIPRFKIAISGNNKPAIDDIGKAMQRRIHVVLFNQEIADKDKNVHIKEDLKEEWEGILWKLLHEGYRQWKRLGGLMVPHEVRKATNEYIEEEDAVGQWIIDHALKRQWAPDDYEAFTSISVLYNDWCGWAADNGEPKGSKKLLTRALKQHGYRYWHSGSVRGFYGLYIAPPKSSNHGEDDNE